MGHELKGYRPCGGALGALGSTTLPPDRTITHRVYFSDLPGALAGAPQTPFELTIDGPEAHHAVNAKRLRVGESIELFDGRGTIARAEVLAVSTGKRASLSLSVHGSARIDAVTPRIELWCPPPKGDRLETMIDQLSQLGVAVWRPLRAARAERDTFRVDRLERAIIESAKQCGRAWLLEIGPWAAFDDALGDERCRLCDVSGELVPPATDAGAVLVLGPEGGWTPDELERFCATGRPVVRFGPHVMRIETAAVAGASVLLAGAVAQGVDHPGIEE